MVRASIFALGEGGYVSIFALCEGGTCVHICIR